MADHVHRLPLSDEELAAAEQQQVQRRNVERARLEREAIEGRMNRGVAPQVVRAAEGEDEAVQAAINENVIRSNQEVKKSVADLMALFAASSRAPVDDFLANEGGDAPEPAKITVGTVASAEVKPPPPKPKPRPRKPLPVDDDDTASTVRAALSEMMPKDRTLDPAMKQFQKIFEVWSAMSKRNPVKANRDFAIELRRHVPLFILSPQIDIGKVAVWLNAIIKIDESAPVKDSSENDEELMRKVRIIQQAIDSVPDEPAVDYRGRTHMDEDDEGE